KASERSISRPAEAIPLYFAMAGRQALAPRAPGRCRSRRWQTPACTSAAVPPPGGAPGTSPSVKWKVNIEPLAATGFAVCAFDQPGFGLTDNPNDYSLDFRFAHSRAFVDKMKIGRYHIMGNSMGAYLAARLALEDSRVERL